MLDIIKDLCLKNAPSGYEDEVIHALTVYLNTMAVPYRVYPSGNVIVSLPADSPNAPKLMVQCHMDEVGFIIKGHRDGGYLSFSPLGISDTAQLVGKRITLLTDRILRGSIGAVPIHLSKDKDKPQMDDLYVDVGAKDKIDASKSIPIGTFGCFHATPEFFGKDASFVSGKALSSRVPCAILLKAISELRDKKLSSSVHFTFTVRGKLSLCGATEAYSKISPDTVISVVSTPAMDTPDSSTTILRTGKGVAIPNGEIRCRFDKSITEQLRNAAKSLSIGTQQSRPITEDDADEFELLRMKNEGARLAVIRLPVRNIHSACEVMSISDALDSVKLLSSALRDILI